MYVQKGNPIMGQIKVPGSWYRNKTSKNDEIHILYPRYNSSKCGVDHTIYPLLKSINFRSFSFVLRVMVKEPKRFRILQPTVNIIDWGSDSNNGLSIILKNGNIYIKANNSTPDILDGPSIVEHVVPVTTNLHFTILISVINKKVNVYLKEKQISSGAYSDYSSLNPLDPIIFFKNGDPENLVSISQCYVIPFPIIQHDQFFGITEKQSHQKIKLMAPEFKF